MSRRFFVPLAACLAVMGACSSSPETGETPSRAEQEDAKAQQLEALSALPYVDVVTESPERKEKTGVKLHDPERAFQGFSLYCNHFEETTGAYLIDMNGEVVHSWSVPGGGQWKLVALHPDGSVVGSLVTDDSSRLVKLDWSSQEVFSVEGEFHHDLHVFEDGSMLTLRREVRSVKPVRRTYSFHDDLVTFLSPNGEIAREVSLWKLLSKEPRVMETLIRKANSDKTPAVDLFHANTASPMDRRIPGFCEAGDVLVCARNLDFVFVLDPERAEVRWKHYGGETWQYPHEPTLAPNGKILIFDNGWKRKYSRVLEIDPFTREIAWEYVADPPRSFFTIVRGSVQRFPNGNTLVTESDTGRVFEITRDGDTVWEWYNPLFSKDDERAIVFKMKRFAPSFFRPDVPIPR